MFKNSDMLALMLLMIVFIITSIFIYNYTNLQWDNKDALNQYYVIEKKYGKPNIIDKNEGGLAIWKTDKLKNTCFDKIELHDESIPHCVPSPHRDFLYYYVTYDVPNNKLQDILSLSGSVSYDPLKKLLRARCGSEEANIGTLYLAVAMGNGRITLEEIQKGKLYQQIINSLKSRQNVQMYYDRLVEYLKNQPGNPNWTGYSSMAFPEGCCEGYNPKKNTCNTKEGFHGNRNHFMNHDKEHFGDHDKNHFMNHDKEHFGEHDKNHFMNHDKEHFGEHDKEHFGEHDKSANEFSNYGISMTPANLEIENFDNMGHKIYDFVPDNFYAEEESEPLNGYIPDIVRMHNDSVETFSDTGDKNLNNGRGNSEPVLV